MININELRLRNYILQKANNKISMVKCGYAHFELVNREGTKDLYPVVLKPEILEQCGFTENMDYPLRPQAREFVLALPIHGSNKNELRGFLKTNGECFGRALINDLPASNNFFHLHQLQNLFHALTGQELEVNR